MRSLPLPCGQPRATISSQSPPLLSMDLAMYVTAVCIDLSLRLLLYGTTFAPELYGYTSTDRISVQIVVQKRMDGCSPAGIPAFSFAKAFTCISMGLSSRAFRDKYTTGSEGGADPAKYCQMLSMVNITDGKMAPFPVSGSQELWWTVISVARRKP